MAEKSRSRIESWERRTGRNVRIPGRGISSSGGGGVPF